MLIQYQKYELKCDHKRESYHSFCTQLISKQQATSKAATATTPITTTTPTDVGQGRNSRDGAVLIVGLLIVGLTILPVPMKWVPHLFTAPLDPLSHFMGTPQHYYTPTREKGFIMGKFIPTPCTVRRSQIPRFRDVISWLCGCVVFYMSRFVGYAFQHVYIGEGTTRSNF